MTEKYDLTEGEVNVFHKLYFQWKSLLSIIKYITQEHSLDEHIQYYTELAESKYIELELAREVIFENHNIQNANYYEIDFYSSTLTITKEEKRNDQTC